MVQSYIKRPGKTALEEGNKCSYWTKESHGEAFNPLVATRKRNPMIIFLCSVNTERLGVCEWERKRELARRLHRMASNIGQPIYLKLHLSLPAASNSPKGLMVVSQAALSNIQPHNFFREYCCYLPNQSLSLLPRSHSSPSSINHLWVRSLHHNRNLPRQASPLPSPPTCTHIHKHTSMWR